MIVGLIGIKLLITNRYEAGIKTFGDFTKILNQASPTSAVRKVANSEPVMAKIKRCLTGLGDAGYKIQNKHLQEYLKIAKKVNKTVLPALVNPRPLLAQSVPELMQAGTLNETRAKLDYAWFFFDICPGAKEKIKKFLGPSNVNYNVGDLDYRNFDYF